MFGLDAGTEIALVIGMMTAVTFLLVIAAVPSGSSRRMQRRLQRVTDRKSQPTRAAANDPATRSLTRRDTTTPGLDRFFALFPRKELLIERLSKTGYEITVGQYGLIVLGTIVVLFAIMLLFFGLSLLPSIGFAVALGLFLPHYVVGYLGKKRTARFVSLFPEAIDLMVRALRAGLPISEAIINAGQEIGDPIGTELRSIEAGLRLGRDLDSLLWDIAKRVDVPEFRFFNIALSVQRETGGNLAETLNNLSDVLRKRRAMRAKARAMASEARASTAILGSLPIVVTGILELTSPDYIKPMFTDVRGLVMLGVAVGMLLGGIGIMVKMARFEI